MLSINKTIDTLRALENALIDTQCVISDKERERLVIACFKTIVEGQPETETQQKTEERSAARG